jgi:uncharacterized membrane protein (DUF106 family)
MISSVLWILGIGGLMLLVFVISEGIGEIFGLIQEVVGGLVAGIMSLILKPFPFLLKILIGGAIVLGSFYLVYIHFKWYWLLLVGYIWFAAFVEREDM